MSLAFKLYDNIDSGKLVEMFNNKEVGNENFMIALKAAEPNGRSMKMFMLQIHNLKEQ